MTTLLLLSLPSPLHERLQSQSHGHRGRKRTRCVGDDRSMEDAPAVSENGDGGGRSRKGSTHDPSTSPSASTGHKRSLSGSILSKLPFLRSSFEENARPALPTKSDKADGAETDRSTGSGGGGGGAMAGAIRATKTRKRKGSLRKTALLGTGKLRLQGRERSNSLKSRSNADESAILSPVSPEELTPRHFSYSLPSQASSSDSGWHGVPHLNESLSLSTSPDSEITPRPTLASPMDSGQGHAHQPYASTTDDDESLTFSRAPTISSSASSYFPLQNPSASTSLQRRRSTNKHATSLSSPLSRPPVQLDDEWDYTETEWWGWVVLVVTWIVFVVGMGSCLGVWSWAWDVGETPYAPPELEDDPTLPIVGYYPALIILTAVMAWVWVVIAWVGMKYFRHAKVVGDDG